jgi:hypothetical protein
VQKTRDWRQREPLDFRLTHAAHRGREVLRIERQEVVFAAEEPPCAKNSGHSGFLVLGRTSAHAHPADRGVVSSVLLFGLGLLALQRRDEQKRPARRRRWRPRRHERQEDGDATATGHRSVGPRSAGARDRRAWSRSIGTGGENAGGLGSSPSR